MASYQTVVWKKVDSEVIAASDSSTPHTGRRRSLPSSVPSGSTSENLDRSRVGLCPARAPGMLGGTRDSRLAYSCCWSE